MAKRVRAGRRGRREALTPVEAVAAARLLLLRCGFEEAARSSGGASLYLRRPGGQAVLRVSTHGRTPRSRQRHTDVVISVVFRDTRSPAQIAHAVATGIREFEAVSGVRSGADRDRQAHGGALTLDASEQGAPQ